MPVDEFGFRADIIFDPIAVFNRMNTGQLNEQFFNRAADFVRGHILADTSALRDNNGNPIKPFEYIVEFLNWINPNYAKLIMETYMTEDERARYIQDCMDNHIHIHVPPFLDTISTQLVIDVAERYGVEETPVSFNLYDEYGVKSKVTTVNPVCIGSKYMYLLYKMPEPSASGIGYVNQYKTPVKPSPEVAKGYPIRQTPVRFGEDELRLMQGLEDPSVAIRLACLQANSPKGVDMLAEELLTAPNPSAIDTIPITNEELIENNTIIGTIHHINATVGIESRVVNCDPLNHEIANSYIKGVKL